MISYILFLVFIISIIILFFRLKRRNFFKRMKGEINLNSDYKSCGKCIVSKDKGSCKNCDSFLNSDFKVEKIIPSNNPSPSGIISYSLFIPKGREISDSFIQRYILPLKENINYSKNSTYFKDWVIRVYISPLIYSEFSGNSNVDSNVEFCIMNKESELYEGSLWRFLACDEKIPVLFLDADDSLEDFEKKYAIDVEKWLSSSEQFFKRNLSFLSLFIKISAGAWGNKRPIHNIKARMNMYIKEEFGNDESFLRKEIYPLFQEHGYYTTGYVYNILSVLVIVYILTIAFIYFRRKNEVVNTLQS